MAAIIAAGSLTAATPLSAQTTATTQTAAQDHVVSGMVFDKTGEPLVGANVRVTLGRKVWTAQTDSKGAYRVKLPVGTSTAGLSISASYLGMKRQTKSGRSNVAHYDFMLDDHSQSLGEAVVTGYGTISTREKTSAITSLKMEEILMPGMTSLEQALEGRVPDMVFMQNSGEVGATARMRIRGTSTLIGNREPLWVLDGIPLSDPVDVTNEQLNDPDYINYIGNAISGINPQDIERVDVLKDAAATALYGTRAANGVIVVTTKKGEPGPPRITYNSQFKFTARPRYSDRNIYLMNSQERVQFGQELMNLHYTFPNHMTMVGYEGAYHRFVTGQTDYNGFLAEVQRAETVNTDWFKLLTHDTFNHNHTVALSGGSETARYYASLGYNREEGVQLHHNNDRYTASLNMQTRIAKVIQANIRLNANVQKKTQLPGEIDLLGYAYGTTRALPAFNNDGSYFFYQRHAYNVGTDKNEQYKYAYNILNEIENAEKLYSSNGIMAALDLTYRFKTLLDLTLTTSYQRTHSDNSTWFGEKSNYAAQLRNAEYGQAPIPGDYGLSDMPYGGVYNTGTNVNENFTLRAQANFRHALGEKKQHLLSASLGYEMNISNTDGFSENTRGFFKSRGLKYVNMTAEEMNRFPKYASWVAHNHPTLRADKTHRLSGYAIFSYSYGSLFSLSANTRFDASNKFGSRSNEKFLPVWSASGMLNLKSLLLRQYDAVSDLRLRTSFGKTGNMVDNQTPNLLLRQESLDTYYGENVAKVDALPNPYLRWEQTDQWNVGVDASLFDYRLTVGVDAYYKHTKDAFDNTLVSPFNGVENYVMNGSDITNSGFSINLSAYLLKTRDWSWLVSANYSVVYNSINTKTANKYKIEKYLNGTAIMDGKSIGTFYSYNFIGLDPQNGLPLFDDYRDRQHLLEGQALDRIMERVGVVSGSREPNFAGSFYSTLRYQQWSLSASFNYALGNKIRKFALYKDVLDGVSSENNVRKEFTHRWRKPGDERHTQLPSLISPSDPAFGDNRYHWSAATPAATQGFEAFADNYWMMYDNSNARVVSGSYLRLSNLALRYQFTRKQLKGLPFSNLAFDAAVTNVFTLKSSALEGQDPTQSGFSLQTSLSLRPSFTFGLRVSF
jgi:tonB-linked outer membrane protein, susC/ragA family